jgi:hypothetical protein
LEKGSFKASRNPHGNDVWDYEATLDLIFSNGHILTYKSSGRNGFSAAW